MHGLNPEAFNERLGGRMGSHALKWEFVWVCQYYVLGWIW